MKQLAATASVIAFFILAFVGMACNVPLHVVAMRAGVGAVILYLVFWIAAKILIGVAAGAAARTLQQRRESQRFARGTR